MKHEEFSYQNLVGIESRWYFRSQKKRLEKSFSSYGDRLVQLKMGAIDCPLMTHCLLRTAVCAGNARNASALDSRPKGWGFKSLWALATVFCRLIFLISP